MKRLFYSSLILLMLGACAPTVNYVGKTSYPMTEKVDVFYAKEDVGKSFETIGHAEIGPLYSKKDIQKGVDKLTKDASTRGADAIIVDGIGTTISSSGSSGSVSSTEQQRIKATFIKYK